MTTNAKRNAEIIATAKRGHHNVSEISERFGLSKFTVYGILRTAGVTAKSGRSDALTDKQIEALAVYVGLEDRLGVTPTLADVADEIDSTIPVVVRRFEVLEERGFVESVTHRGARRWRITPAGRDVVGRKSECRHCGGELP